ncbi:GtrA family protein [Serinibacter arcticus]|uniref:Putative integral membrane protein n=1 Tax=Serinibacter arcticus TaxID=1655435 RepID=A0A4Z1DX38_9MICO|nr:GtrA family protein [Serinibacter arcticus]TGO04104.1 putative integral membrane protein [Serinibacter arcticus]
MWRALVAELAKFGVVGAVAYVVDVGLFNLLRYGPGEVLGEKPLTAKIIAAVVATVVAWVGNRQWTFADRRMTSKTREFIAYAIVNVAGMGVAVASLWVSHYVLGFTSPFADNLSANVIGVGLGTIVRYLGYRLLVFRGEPVPAGKAGVSSAPRP